MKKMFQRGLSLVLTLIMVAGLLPVTAFAAVDSTGKPTDLKNTVVLSIYTPEGSFPGEPAMHGSEDYVSFNSKFAKTSASGKFKDSAVGELKLSVLDDLVQGASSGNNTVWGVFSAEGLKEKYFESGASIIQPENEAEIIRVIKGNSFKNKTDEEILKNYEIIWYVIKLQHSPGSGWWGRATTEWHIDGVIREKKEELITINYYGNGNTEGSAPDGVTNHIAGTDYTVLAGNNMKKKINGVYVDFLGWSAKADGSGDEIAFYQPGDVIQPSQNLSLYAMWDTTTQYTATVNTYLDNVLTDDNDIHGKTGELFLSTDGEHYYKLTRSSEGVYTVRITGNGKFHLYHKETGGDYEQVGTNQLTIYNQNGSMDLHHYSVTYDPNEGAFATEPETPAYPYGSAITAIDAVPVRDGYRFLGWEDAQGNLIQSGKEVTAFIEAPVVLTAKWEKTVNVTVNVTINHHADEADGGGYDKTADGYKVSLALVSRENSTSPYLEVEGKTLNLTKADCTSDIDNVSKYTGNTFTDMPGGTAEYSVVTSKSDYETSITQNQDENGDWIIDVVMTYKPTNFDIDFTVKVADSVPAEYRPAAAIVKVTFWAADHSEWQIITQQEGDKPGVRVELSGGEGSGSYPVWQYKSGSNDPYGYRVQVSSFVYPDGTIVPASEILQENVQWSDNVYTATMDPVTGGQTYGTLPGAYFDDATNGQKGTLNVVITMDLHKVTFDAQGGKVNGNASQTLEKQYKIPDFKNYIPVREGGYTFGGWYEDAACTVPATAGKDLTADITLYAKWIEPLTISGTVTISGTYQQNGETIFVNDIDRATEAVVVLQELRNGVAYDVDSQTVSFGAYEASGSGEYSFTGIPNDGKSYQIHILELNYGTAYDNESDANSTFSADEYLAVFGNDTTADVDADLTFVPPSYDQNLVVDATRIGTGFRPANVLSEVLYRDTGDNHAYRRISQHNAAPYGVQIGLTDGTGNGTQSIWKWHTDGTLYEYQMNITQVNGEAFDSDTAPYYIDYAAPAYWKAGSGEPSGDLKATLIPKQYHVTLDLNAGEDEVTGMDAYKNHEADEENATDTHHTTHKWSFDTTINATPEREGYTFAGWTAEEGLYADGKIPAAVHQEVVLTAQWVPNNYTVETVSNPEAGGTTEGAGSYPYRTEATVTATPAEGYHFSGWYQGEELVSEEAEYTFTVTSDVTLTANFSKNPYTVTTVSNPAEGGTTSGAGIYEYETTATVVATPAEGYHFTGWKQGEDLVSEAAEYTFEVTSDVTLTASFEKNSYTVDTVSNPEAGGTTAGGGSYLYNDEATVTATPATGYYFSGWYQGEDLVSNDASYTFTVTSDVTLTANFSKNPYTVNTVSNPAEGGTTSGAGTYEYETAVTVGAAPAEGYHFSGWYQGETLVSEAAEYTFEVTSDVTLTASFEKNSYTVDTVSNPEAGGTTAGGGSYLYRNEATVTATPADGYYFSGWYQGETLVSNDAEYTFEVTSDVTLTANFNKDSHTVITKSNPEDGGVTTGRGSYLHGDEATVTATPATGYHFTGWYQGEKLVSEKAEYTFAVTSNVTLTANFSKDPHTVATKSNPEVGGTTEGAGSYLYGDEATVTATSATGYHFAGWSRDGEVISTDASYTFTVTSDVELIANFEKNSYTVDTVDTTGGTTTGGGVYEYEAKATVVATAESGYKFTGWYEGDEKVSDDASYTFTVTSDRTLKATFATAYTITTNANPENAGTLSGGGVYEPRAEATITAKAKSGYYFAGWYDEQGNLYTADQSFKLTVIENRTFTAKFERKVAYRCDYVYLFGYTDTQIGATGPLLRGELSQMIYRLVKQNTGVGNGGITFADTSGEWFQSGISYMASKGAIDRSQQNAYPHVAVTCGETYKMICLGLGFTSDSSLNFSEYAAILRNSGFLSDDAAVTSKITRHQFCTLFNAILGRSGYPLEDAAGNEITAETYGYTDLDSGASYYRTMMIATSTFTNGKVDLAKRIQRNTYDYGN